MTFSIGVIESDTVSTSNMPQLPLCKNFKIQSQLLFCKVSFQDFKIVTALREFQNSESTSFLPNEFSKFQNRCRFARISKFRVNFFFARWVLSQSCRIGRWIRSIRSRWRGLTINIYSWPFMTNSHLLVLVSSLSSDHDHRWPTAWYHHFFGDTSIRARTII